MSLLIHSIFQNHQEEFFDDEERFVMRIDHTTPRSAADDNTIRYFKDNNLHSKDFRDLFVYDMNHGNHD